MLDQETQQAHLIFAAISRMPTTSRARTGHGMRRRSSTGTQS
jgi:hypothetical protein